MNAEASALVTAGKVAVFARTRRAEDLLLLIDRRKEQILDDFYDIGMALREILEKKLFEALGYASFDAEERAAAKTARAASDVRAAAVARREADEWRAVITVPMAQLRDIVRER